MKRLLRIYDPALDWALSHRRAVLGSAAGLLVRRARAGLRPAAPRGVARLAARGWPGAARLAAGHGQRVHAHA